MSDNEKKESKGLLLGFLAIPIATIIAITALYVVTAYTLTNSSFYTGILANSQLIKTFVEASNKQISKDIQSTIDNKIKINDYKEKFEESKRDYTSAYTHYENLYKESEYKAYKNSSSNLFWRGWKGPDSGYKTKEEFEKNKKTEMTRLKNEIKTIEKFREDNKEKIELAKKDLEEKKDKLKEAGKEYQSRQEQIKDLIKDKSNTFSAKLYSDIEKLSPKLTEILDTEFFQKALKQEIEKLITFMSTYDKQLANGKVAYVSEGYGSGELNKKLKITLPEITLPLWIYNKETNRREHLFSKTFVREIEKMNNLKNKFLLVTMFKATESGLVEAIGNNYLKKRKISLRNGIIRVKPRSFEGSSAGYIEMTMIALTYKEYGLYVIGGLFIFLILMLLISNASGFRRLGVLKWTLIIPSLISIVIGIGGIAGAIKIYDIKPDLFSSITVRMYMHKLAISSSFYLFLPMIAVFAGVMILGMFIRKIQMKKKPA